MSGRGAVITIRLLRDAVANDTVEEISLPVALHSRLEILKEELLHQTGIPIETQVLILLDLSDRDRNNDKVLTENEVSLKACGIKNGSVLSLHALGLENERQSLAYTLSLNSNDKQSSEKEETIHILETRVAPKDADHSYSGVIFDLECKGPHEVTVHSISIGGMLGRIRIFVRDRPWEADKPRERRSIHHYWATTGKLSKHGWSLSTDRVCKASWDKPQEIMLDTPIILFPHSRRGIYLHSNLPDDTDLGIQYQSYRKDDIVAEDEILAIHPGLGHTGSTPFDEEHGWYREWRGPAGTIQYKYRLKSWSPRENVIFPKDFRDAVFTMLLCQHKEVFDQNHNGGKNTFATSLFSLPTYLIYNIIEFCNWDFFAQNTELYNSLITNGGNMKIGEDFDNEGEYDDDDDEMYEEEEDEDDEEYIPTSGNGHGGNMQDLLAFIRDMGHQISANGQVFVPDDFGDENSEIIDEDYDDDGSYHDCVDEDDMFDDADYDVDVDVDDEADGDVDDYDDMVDES